MEATAMAPASAAMVALHMMVSMGATVMAVVPMAAPYSVVKTLEW
jgi:hypothetical protein